MDFVPLTPDRLVEALAGWLEFRRRHAARTLMVGFDGPAECGVSRLTDQVGAALSRRAVPAIRASTSWWWRPAALRLEQGREDVEMLLTAWVDAPALQRELIEPAWTGRPVITQLRDPATDRSVRQRPQPVPPGAVVLLDGPLLLAAELPLEAVVGFRIGRATLSRALREEQHWQLPAFAVYEQRCRPERLADVVLAYDHPSAPAAAGLSAQHLSAPAASARSPTSNR